VNVDGEFIMKKLITDDFSFGFEFEGFAPIEKFLNNSEVLDNACVDDYSDLRCNILQDDCDMEDLIGDFYENIGNFFKNNGFYGCVQYDGSLRYGPKGYNSFEWSSPILKLNPSSIQKVKNLFHKMEINGIEINDTCGFHTHISYKNITENDIIWILLYIASDLKIINEFEKLWLDDNNFVNFVSNHYADNTYLYEIHNGLKKKRITDIVEYINLNKYRLLRLHPQGTLEWRGPRGFLFDEKKINTYFKKLFKVVNIIKNAINCDEIYGMKRDELLKTISKIKFNNINKSDESIGILPNQSYVQKRKDSYGILGDEFQYRRTCIPQTYIENILDKLLYHPELIVEDKIVNLPSNICYYLNKNNRLRKTIESVLDKGIELPNNLQYLMIKENPTMIPYLSENFIVSIHSNVLFECMKNKFNYESDYKYKTLDYIFDELPKYKNISEYFELMFKIYTNLANDWIRYYLLNNKDKIINALEHYDSKKYNCYIERLRKYDTFSDIYLLFDNILDNEKYLLTIS
jgi:hypothetical protein